MTRRSFTAPRYLAILIVIAFTFFGQTGAIRAQATPAATPAESEEIRRLKEEKEKADLRKQIAEAKAAEIDAKFPKPTTTPLAGETTIDDNVVIETQIRSYNAMNEVAAQIANSIKDKKTIAVYDPKIKAYRSSKQQLEFIFKRYCNVYQAGNPLVCPGAGAAAAGALTIASSVLGQAVDLTSLLRTNVEIKGKSFTIDEPAIVSAIFASLPKNGAERYYPAMFPPRISSGAQSDFLTLLERAINARNFTQGWLAALDAADAAVRDAKTAPELAVKQAERAAQRATFQTLLHPAIPLDPAIATLKLINDQVQAYITDLLKVDESAGTNALTSYIRTEQLESLVGEEGHWLQVKVVAAGGNNRIKTNLLWDIFTGGNRLSHSGGVIVQYFLFNAKGSAVDSGTVTKYLYYVKSNKIK
ncbi:MAG: hypothetical protein ABL999_16935 [Pyrinomonadaceae bacterium]